MEFSMFCSRISFLILIIVLSSPPKFNQSPMDFGPLNLLQATNTSSLDFGRIYFNSPSAVVRPKSPKEISLLLSSLSGSSFSKVTVAARGAGHSINGQAQALNGIVVEMDSLPSSIKIRKRVDGESSPSYVDVSGGTLWVDLLKETLKEGLAPRSWTDYLYLTIGGTLSNAGISGQTFKYGPQISNVLQLDVVTGRGDIVTCSPTISSELFYGVLGGLGQFGIITSARILLQEAPRKVKWVRAYYDDFDIFTKDQELLIGMGNMVDYLEGFIVLNKESLHGGSISFPFPANLASIPQFQSEPSKVYYCIEFAVYDQADKNTNLDQVVEEISSKMSFMPSLLYSVEVSYFDFLQRVRMEEISLRELGLWDVSHPWLNMFVPKSGIAQFRDLLLENISPSTFMGPILIYPISRDKWNLNMSAVLPESISGENIIYIVGILRSANPTSCSQECLQGYLRQNLNITNIATDPKGGIGAKQYLSHHRKEEQWREHFGGKWQQFLGRKKAFDPLNILAPGQGIFKRRYSMNPTTTTTTTLTLSSSQ
ncbi:cytokinin dehydrogenase 3-like [Macadamia integrifolia]|uniref:cytokinin dehydrogenase 3-like n=1 Tax=Macadamia integrifolia TaxID=60698 RepID=UPI001C4F512A|nr:cytokinin dehydrogenase 3-like [Macadamia integrifolia]